MVELRPENHVPWRLFKQCRAQWKYVTAGMGGMIRVGLDYPAVQVVMAMSPLVQAESLEPWEIFDSIQLLESAQMAVDDIKRDGNDVVRRLNALIE